MAVVIAGERSGVGKTTVTLALLAALRRRSTRVQSFKVGPDYIDPMFHAHVTGRPCYNLDSVLTSENYVQQCFYQHSQTAEFAVVEGVMGLFDGASGSEETASTGHIARLLDLPIVLVLDCSRLSRSIAAVVHGYRSFDPRLRFAGLILNRVGSDRHLELLQSALEPLSLPILGVLRRQENITIPDRHLGLVPAEELGGLQGVIDRLAALADACLDWSRLLPLLSEQTSSCKPQTSSLESLPLKLEPQTANREPETTNLHRSPKIAVARDRAFNFYYAANLDMLQTLGAELVFWSPLVDAGLPSDINGLYLGGGFPEVFAAELAANQAAQQAVRQTIAAGMPAYAECGGLMYLTQQITDLNGDRWNMVGMLPTQAQMSQRLTLGYRRATALQDGLMLAKGQQVWGHEFHRSTLTATSEHPLYQIQGYDAHSPTQREGWQLRQLSASYVHLHWGAMPEVPTRFLAACARYADRIQLAASQN